MTHLTSLFLEEERDREESVQLKMVLLLILLLQSVTSAACRIQSITSDGSTACGTAGLSLYLTVCCAKNNLGQSVTINDNDITSYILCPTVTPRSCPPPGNGSNNVIAMIINIIKTVIAGTRKDTLLMVFTILILMKKHLLR